MQGQLEKGHLHAYKKCPCLLFSVLCHTYFLYKPKIKINIGTAELLLLCMGEL
jgi:hypothetical protein